MRKKTIGEVFFLERRNQGLSLEDVEKKTDIQVDFLKMIEKDDFDHLPSSFYTRSFLKKYAQLLDLDEEIVLDAYESASLITYDEVEVLPEESRRMRRVRRNKSHFLPIFYLSLLSLFVLIFISYFLWRHYQASDLPTNQSSVSLVSSDSSSLASSSQETLASSTSSQMEVETSSDLVILTLSAVKEPVNLTLTVDNTSSWVSITNSQYADGVTLDSETPSLTTALNPGTSTDVLIGNTSGLTVKVNEQTMDLTSFTNLTGTIRLIVKE